MQQHYDFSVAPRSLALRICLSTACNRGRKRITQKTVTRRNRSLEKFGKLLILYKITANSILSLTNLGVGVRKCSHYASSEDNRLRIA